MNEVRDLIYETKPIRGDLTEGSLRVQHEYILFFLAFLLLLLAVLPFSNPGSYLTKFN